MGLRINKLTKILGTFSGTSSDPLLTSNAVSGSVDTANNLFGSLNSANIWVGSVANLPVARLISGDISISNVGGASITNGVITDAKINNSAAITLSKLAALVASKAVVTDGSGFMTASTTTATQITYLNTTTSDVQAQINSKQAIITGAATSIVSSNLNPNIVVVSDGGGKVTSSAVTTTVLGYISTLNSNAQTQIDTKLTVSLAAAVIGDIIFYNGSNWTNLPRGTAGQTLQSTSGSIQWGTPTINGIPSGGTTHQFLAKNSATNFDASWYTLTTSLITDITATASQLNTSSTYLNTSGVPTGTNGQVLTISGSSLVWASVGSGTVTSVAFSGGTTGLTVSGSPITASGTITLAGTLVAVNGGTGQSAVATGDILYGSAVNTWSRLVAGTNGYILTMSGGVPTWATAGGGGVSIGGTVSGGTSGSVLWVGVASALSQDNNNFFWSSGSHILSINTNGDQTGVDSINVYNEIDAYKPNSTQGAIGSGTESAYTVSSSRGTGASPTVLSSGDLLGGFSGWGYTGASPSYLSLGGVWVTAQGAASTLGGKLDFQTRADGGSLTSRLTVDNTGTVTITAFGTTGIVHNNSSGVLSTSLIVAADVTANTLTYNKIQQGTALSVLGNSTNSTANLADIVAASDFQILRRSGTAIGFGSIDLSQSNAVGASVLGVANGGTGSSTVNVWLLASGGTLTGANTITGTSSNILKYIFDSLGTTVTEGAGAWFANTIAATLGNQQISPIITLEGQGWDTGLGGSGSKKVRIYNVPLQDALGSSQLFIRSNFNGGSFGTNLIITANTTNSIVDFFASGSSGIQVNPGGGYINYGAGSLKIGSSTDGTTYAGSAVGFLMQSNFGTSGIFNSAHFNLGTLNPGGNNNYSGARFTSTYTPGSGSPNFIHLLLTPTINTSGTFSGGNVTMLDIAATLTSTTGVTGLYGILVRSSSFLNGFGTATPTATLQVNGISSTPTLKTVGAGSTTNYSIRSFQSDGTTEIYNLLDNGSFTHTSPPNGGSFSSTYTATANNQYAVSHNGTITSRSTASDSILGDYFNRTLIANSTLIDIQGVTINTTLKTNSGVTSTQNGSSSNFMTSTLAGMTITTFTSVSPSSTSGTGSGSLFTVVVSSATLLTSITVTTAGSGYNYGDTLTFNGSLFGGSGAITIGITGTTNTLGVNATVLRLIQGNGNGGGTSKNFIDFQDGAATSVFQIGTSILNSNSIRNINFTDPTGIWLAVAFNAISVNRTLSINATSNFNNNILVGLGQTYTPSGYSLAVNMGSNTSGAALFSAAVSAPGLNVNNGYNVTSSGYIGGFISTGKVQAMYSSQIQGISTASGQQLIGIPNTISFSPNGSGYSAGTKATTGGTGTGLQVTITVSGGVPQTCVVATKGQGYTNGDVITISTGGANSTFTILTVDWASSIASYYDGNYTTTDSKSIWNYYTLYTDRTYNVTSAQAGTIGGFVWNPTLTATGSFNVYGLNIVPTGTKNGIGTSAPDATWYIKGAGAIPTLKTIGVGTTTNYSQRAFQSDGTTEIYSLQDSGLSIHTALINGSQFTSTWTATANNQNAFEFLGTITSRNTNTDTLNYVVVDPTLTRNAGNPTGQTLTAVLINPTFTNNASVTSNLLKINNAGTQFAVFSNSGAVIGPASVTSNVALIVSSIGAAATLVVKGQGAGGASNFTTQDSGAAVKFTIFDYGAITSTQTALASATTNYLSFTQGAHSGGSNHTGFTYTAGALTAQTTTFTDFNIAITRTVTLSADLTPLKNVLIGNVTYTSASAHVVTNAYGFYLSGAPVFGSNITGTTTAAVYIDTVNVGAGATNSAGLIVNAQTGATNNYAAQFLGGSTNFAAGTTTYASINIPSGTLKTTPATGDIEFDGTNYSGSISTNRYIFAKTLVASATLDFPNTSPSTASDLTVTVTGAALNDEVDIGIPNGSVLTGAVFWGWVSATNTVTVRYYNGDSLASHDPASGTYRVTVIKH